MTDWKVFQTDVLDLLRQYEGYFDFFERVGSLTDNSRPDCFARISRSDKKEIWVLDAKNKGEVDESDLERMEKYISMAKTNPIDIGLDTGEISEYEIRGIFITNGDGSTEEYEQISFKGLHSFLQKELIYTDSDKVVRDVAKMLERKQLSQSQARLLFRSLKPFERRMNQGLKVLERLSTDLVGSELEKPPIETFEHNIPVDAVLRHDARDVTFLFDVPYSSKAVKDIEQKLEQVREVLGERENVYYTAINTLGEADSDYILRPEEVREEVLKTANVVPPSDIADLFEPKIPVEKEYFDRGIRLTNSDVGFKAEITSTDDIKHEVRLSFPEETASNVKDHLLNTRKLLRQRGKSFTVKLEVTENGEVRYLENEETLASFSDSVKNLYSSAVNPSLGRKLSQTVAQEK